jgi:beta-galactosidase
MQNKASILKVILLFLAIFESINAQVVIPDKGIPGSDIQSLNGIWKFKYIPSVSTGSDSAFYKNSFNVKNWKDIKVPGHWELQGFSEPRYGGDVQAGTGLYRTDFLIPGNWKSKHIYIVFDGVLYGYHLWINGKYAGTWGSSYNRMMFDITKYITIGKSNTLAVKVTTRNKGWEFDTNDCWGLSGIFRNVTLLGVPQTHIKDFTVKTYTNNNKNAQIALTVLLNKYSGSESFKDIAVAGKLFSPDGKMIKEFTSADLNLSPNVDTVTVFNSFIVENPLLWTAETPWLYNLELTLKSNDKELQRIQQKIGIRQITIENGILKVNGQAIKLRGVDHHDIDPVAGRALNDDMIIRDLVLMKQANINFIRTSHYPPHPEMIDFCDSMGIYVMCEVPFGFGDKHLTDTSYLDILIKRAKATVGRDKNHPSVIIWSIGNENPLTPIALKTGLYVKKIDNTRPVCYPQMGSYFKNNFKDIPDSVDVLSPHYGDAKTLENYAHMFNRPLIATEYAHALGLDFDKVESMWEVMYKYPGIAGGAVWHFQDQGILRVAEKKVDVDSFTESAWTDSIHYYDTQGNKGCDGLVYSNRVPQTDYWQLRKVYTPVKALDDSIIIKPGSQIIKIKINNRFDFNDLSDIHCKWMLTGDNKSIQEGWLSLKCNPHDTVSIPVSVILPEKLSANYYLLNLYFYNEQNYQFTEKTYRLWYRNNLVIANKDIGNQIVKNNTLNETNNSINALFNKTLLTIGKNSGEIKIDNIETNQLLLAGPMARTGRKNTMSSIATNTRKDSTGANLNWSPHILYNSASTFEKISPNAFKCKYKYERIDKKGEFIEGSVIYTISDSGWINVNYNFVPVNATGLFLEAGISFQVSSDFSEMRWIGNGPFPSFPGKSMLDEFGFYHLNSSDINFQGNRSKVQLMLMTDNNGNGFAITCRNADIAVEKTPEGLLLSHNALVSGRYNKGSLPDILYKAREVKEISGSFSIIPIYGKDTPGVLQKLFGSLTDMAVPYKPFYHSYDQ